MYLLSKLTEDKEVTAAALAPARPQLPCGVGQRLFPRMRAVQVTPPGLVSLVLFPIAATLLPPCGTLSWTRPHLASALEVTGGHRNAWTSTARWRASDSWW